MKQGQRIEEKRKFFKGTFYRCVGLDPDFIDAHIFTKDDCLEEGGEWENAQ